MSVLNENQLLGASGAGGEFEIEQSLRFNDPNSPELVRTFGTATNRKVWTWSGWYKVSLGHGNDSNPIVTTEDGQAQNTLLTFGGHNATNTEKFSVIDWTSSEQFQLVTTALFRDPSAWYHIVVAYDSTQSTSSNRVKIYINGQQVTAFSREVYPPLNYETHLNSAIPTQIGSNDSRAAFFHGYMAETNFIDGQALTPDSFGETGTYGEWKPTKYAGTYGNNGFYLPFKQDYTVEGFSTVTYEGKGVGQYIGGTGFSPSLVWTKARNQTYDHHLFDVIRGPLKRISSNSTSAESSMTNSLTAFNTDGFTLGDTAQVNLNGGEFVAWNWDMGGTTASNTSGSITSSVRANTTYGQSIVSYSGTGSAATVGHGLASAPDMVICRPRNLATHWRVWHEGLTNGTYTLFLNSTGAQQVQSDAFGSLPTSSVFSVAADLNTNTQPYIAYCFHSVTNYSSFGSYSGNGSTTGPTVALGFSTAFLLVKRTNSTGNWFIWDNTRDTDGVFNTNIHPNSSAAEANSGSNFVTLSSTGFQLTGTGAETNASGGTYIYMAFADTREYAYWLDQSGNNNDWTSEGGLTESDVMVDSPTNNFATFNPLDNGGNTLSEGNLVLNVSSGFKLTRSTLFATSGKWYWEILCTDSGNGFVGVSTAAESLTSRGSETSSSVNIATSDGDSRTGASTSSYGSSFADGDIMILALDMDNGKFYAGKNGTWFNSGNPATSANPAKTGLTTALSPSISLYDNEDYNANFGQDSSFAGTKTPQSNADSVGIGDFYYAPPTGFLALCTKSLPSVDVIPSENFNTVIYAGNGGTQSISVGFPTDFTWLKNRGYAHNHFVLDTVRGAPLRLVPNAADAESNGGTSSITSFTSDGFVLGNGGGVNSSSYNYVSWNWKAGGSASSNSNGTITSQVSANVDAGFSIVTYTGNGANDGTGQNSTVGHGLAQKPELIIRKDRDTNGTSWVAQSTLLGSGNMNQALFLNTTSAVDGGQGYMNNTAPTSTVFTLGNQVFVNVSGRDYISYCFHSVDGYSKVGKYVGNGNANGPMVNCGFFPNFVMIKRTDSAAHWEIHDIAREPNNVKTKLLNADQSNAEDNNANSSVDFISNGFKLRTSHAERNASGGTYIYAAFAESPFKNSNAR